MQLLGPDSMYQMHKPVQDRVQLTDRLGPADSRHDAGIETYGYRFLIQSDFSRLELGSALEIPNEHDGVETARDRVDSSLPGLDFCEYIVDDRGQSPMLMFGSGRWSAWSIEASMRMCLMTSTISTKDNSPICGMCTRIAFALSAIES